MYGVSRMGSNVLKNPVKVMELGEQMKGYLKRTQEEGLRYQVGFKEEIVLQAYSDASFSPEGSESHGSFLSLLEGSPIFWRVGHTFNMTEVIEALTAGESIAVMVQELFELVTKMAYTDSQAAEAILTCDGGSWRTRHFRLRSSLATQSISRGGWRCGWRIHDLGTKALSAPRLEKLQQLMSMGSLKEEQKGEESFQEKRRLREQSEVVEGESQKKEGGVKVAEAAQIIKLITLAAAISSAKAVETEKSEDDEGKISFGLMVACYTFFVVLATLFAKQIWKVGVRMVRAIVQTRQVLPPGSLPGEAKRKEKSSKGSVVSSHGERSIVAAPITASSSSSLAQLPLVSLQKSAPRPKGVPKVKSSSKMGHQLIVTPSPKAQPQGSSMPSVEEDIFESWDEIKREERQIRIELNRAKLGDPILGPIDQLPDDEFPDLPLQMFSTRFEGLSCEPQLPTFGLGEHCTKGVKMVQSMPTFCISKWVSACSWCYFVSERIWMRSPL